MLDTVRQNKKCSHCHQTKPLGEFYANRTRTDGLSTQCKQCHEVYMMLYRGKRRWSKCIPYQYVRFSTHKCHLCGKPPRVLLFNDRKTLGVFEEKMKEWRKVMPADKVKLDELITHGRFLCLDCLLGELPAFFIF